MIKTLFCITILCITTTLAYTPIAYGSGEQAPSGGENASNPLSKSRNTDLQIKYYDLDGDSERIDYAIDGSFMLSSEIKVKYELHYWDTDITGEDEDDFESAHLKVIYFPKEGKIGSWNYRLAGGLEWIYDFDNADKGIGSGSDIISPFAGIALSPGKGLMLIPLVQHYTEYDGPDYSQTAFRLIALQSLPDQLWVKADLKIPFDWENDDEIPASAELQIGKMISSNFGLYLDGLLGLGNDRPYDYGVGLGLRFKY